jgi:hypothetical protein
VEAYHLKDAIKNHFASVGREPKDVEDTITNDPDLALLADLANLEKHGRLVNPPRSGTVPQVESVSDYAAGESWLLCVTILHGSERLDAIDVARKSIDAWRRALQKLRVLV